MVSGQGRGSVVKFIVPGWCGSEVDMRLAQLKTFKIVSSTLQALSPEIKPVTN